MTEFPEYAPPRELSELSVEESIVQFERDGGDWSRFQLFQFAYKLLPSWRERGDVLNAAEEYFSDAVDKLAPNDWTYRAMILRDRARAALWPKEPPK
jgi:hypothetical protein